MTAGLGHLLELVMIKILKNRQIFPGLFSKDPTEGLPENFLIRSAAVVAHHGLGALPDGTGQGFGVIAQRSQLFAQTAQIGLDENLLIHGQQGAVQIEQNGGNGHKIALAIEKIE